jgi:hypothetical protein
MRPLATTIRCALAALALALAVSALPATPARAADPDAPPGASPTWLPNEAWVLEHWLPYSDRDLFRILHISQAHLGISDTRSLADIARSRGLKTSSVVTALMKPWRGKVSAAHYRELRSRAMRTFTQPHLAVHMFFHTFHDASMDGALPGILGVPDYPTILRLQAQNLSYAEMAARNGRSVAQVQAAVRQVIARSMASAVGAQWTPRAHVKAWMGLVDTQISGWLAWKEMPGMAMDDHG